MATVEYKGKLWPAALFEPHAVMGPGKPLCGICGDTGLLRETIDEERFDVMVACFNCRRFCKECGGYRGKDHTHEEGLGLA